MPPLQDSDQNVSKKEDTPLKEKGENLSFDSTCDSPDKNDNKHSKLVTAAKLNKRNGKGETPLHRAAIRNEVDKMSEYLCVPGVDVNITDNAGWTPLHEACNHGSIECVKLLLKYVPANSNLDSQFQKKTGVSHKVNINAQGPEGRTPLHDAVINRQIEICKLLLKYGGSKILHVENDFGYTALDLAKSDDNFLKVLLANEKDIYNTYSDSKNSSILAPPSDFLYKQLLGSNSSARYVRASDFSAYLALLSQLVHSYGDWKHCFSKHRCDDHVLKKQLSEEDIDMLKNFPSHLQMFVKHIAKTVVPGELKELEFELTTFCMLCLQMMNCLP